MTVKLALLGQGIAHSRSQAIYEKILDSEISYRHYDYDNESLIPSLNEFFLKNLNGLSITSPYKKHFLNDVVIQNDQIKAIGAINCVKKGPNGIFMATNTDFLAANDLVKKYIRPLQDIVILGSGAMAMMFVLILKEMDLSYCQYSRSVNGSLDKLDFSSRDRPLLLINCCSRNFVFNGKLASKTLFWDMNYNFSPHQKLINQVEYVDGLEFLELQARYALSFFGIQR